MSRTSLKTITAPNYGWVTAKADKDKFEGFKQAAAEYKRQTGKDVAPSYMKMDASGRHLMDWYEANKGKAYTQPTQQKFTSIADRFSNVSPGGSVRDFSRPLNQQVTGFTNSFSNAVNGTYDNPRNLVRNPLSMLMGGSSPKYLDNTDRKPNPWTGYRGPKTYDYQGRIKESVKDLANPNYYTNPELQRYIDGSNPGRITYTIPSRGSSYMDLAGNNTSKTLGGEDNVQAVLDWFKANRSDPSLGQYSSASGTSDPLVQKLMFGDQSYYYTPYDYAISGVGGRDSSGHMLNQDVNFWNNSKFYTPTTPFSYDGNNELGLRSNTPFGFLSTSDPTLGGSSNLGSENTDIGYRVKSGGGGMFGGGGIGSMLKMGMGALAGGGLPGLAFSLPSMAGSLFGSGGGAPDTSGVFKGNFLDGAPFGYGQYPSTNTTPVPNVVNPGSGSAPSPVTSGVIGGTPLPKQPQTFTWNGNNYDVNWNNNKANLSDAEGKSAWNQNTGEGTTQLGNAFNTYLGTL